MKKLLTLIIAAASISASAFLIEKKVVDEKREWGQVFPQVARLDRQATYRRLRRCYGHDSMETHLR